MTTACLYLAGKQPVDSDVLMLVRIRVMFRVGDMVKVTRNSY